MRLREGNRVDPFLPVERSGMSSSSECAEITARLAPADLREAGAVTRLCLQVLRIQHDLLRPRLLDAELVATLPPGTPGIARPTEFVVREMLQRATTEIILLGYEFTDPSIVQLLAAAVERGTNVVIICDRGRGAAARIRAAFARERPLLAPLAPHPYRPVVPRPGPSEAPAPAQSACAAPTVEVERRSLGDYAVVAEGSP